MLKACCDHLARWTIVSAEP